MLQLETVKYTSMKCGNTKYFGYLGGKLIGKTRVVVFVKTYKHKEKWSKILPCPITEIAIPEYKQY